MNTLGIGWATLSHLYGFAGSAARFAVEHIETLKSADNALANRCGDVLEAANTGFGVGHETALILVGLGQRLLGNPLAGAGALSSGHPVVVTCAAIGAIHYGWKAMSDSERDAIIKTVGAAFSVGAEFIRSIASFAYDLIQKRIARENLEELRRIVTHAAEALGRHFSDVSRLLSDRVRESADFFYTTAGTATASALAYVPSFRLPRRSSANGAGAGETTPEQPDTEQPLTRT